MQSSELSPSPISSSITILLFWYGLPLSTAAGRKRYRNIWNWEQKKVVSYWNNIGIHVGGSGVTRTPLMLGHNMGTLCMFVRTSVQSAEAFRGVWGLLPQKILEFHSHPGQFWGYTVVQYESLMANLCTLICDWHWSVPIIRMLTCTGGAQPLVARACAPVCPSLASPLVGELATVLLFTIPSTFMHTILPPILGPNVQSSHLPLTKHVLHTCIKTQGGLMHEGGGHICRTLRYIYVTVKGV